MEEHQLLKVVNDYQCPGCSVGCGVEDGCYQKDENHLACKEHSAGTIIAGIGYFNLGLPKGFNRLGPIDKRIQRTNIRIHENLPKYNAFNVPLWALEHEGNLLIVVALPRLHQFWIDIVPGKNISDLPSTVQDVSKLDLSNCL